MCLITCNFLTVITRLYSLFSDRDDLEGPSDSTKGLSTRPRAVTMITLTEISTMEPSGLHSDITDDVEYQGSPSSHTTSSYSPPSEVAEDKAYSPL